MSKVVPVALQVKIVATPEMLGVHWKTCSGEFPLVAHAPANALAPLVVPVKTPPAAGITIGAAHVPPPGSVVELVLVVVVTLVLVVVVTLVLVVVVTLVLVVVGIDVLVVVGRVVLVVVVGGDAGGTIVSWKLPAAPL